MTNRERIFLTAACICLVLCGTANSGELLTQYNQDLQKLQAEQAKDPNRVIKFSDESGPLAKEVLNIDRVTSVVSEISGEINQLKTLSGLLKSIGPVISKYEAAFSELGEQYENEYLAALRVSVSVFSAAANTVNRQLDHEKVTNPNALKMLQGMKTIMEGARNMMIGSMRENIESGKLSKGGAAAANKIIESLDKSEGNQGGQKKVDSK